MIDFGLIAGVVGSILTVSSMLFQVAKTIRTKSAGDFSLISLLLTIVELLLWIIYSLSIHSILLVFTDSTLLFSILIITYYRIFRRW
jgi:MtN3 and saliva related transmembrane protein